MVGYRDHSLPFQRFEVFNFGDASCANQFRNFLRGVKAVRNSDPPEDVAGGLQVTALKSGFLLYYVLLIVLGFCQ
jgi:hypothetical protein